MGERKILAIAVNGKMNKKCCGRSSVVEFQPSKLAVVGSNPIARSKKDGAGAVIVLLFVSAGIHGDLMEEPRVTDGV